MIEKQHLQLSNRDVILKAIVHFLFVKHAKFCDSTNCIDMFFKLCMYMIPSALFIRPSSTDDSFFPFSNCSCLLARVSTSEIVDCISMSEL